MATVLFTNVGGALAVKTVDEFESEVRELIDEFPSHTQIRGCLPQGVGPLLIEDLLRRSDEVDAHDSCDQRFSMCWKTPFAYLAVTPRVCDCRQWFRVGLNALWG